MKILHNEGGKASGQIFNIGNPANNLSIRDLAYKLLELFKQHPDHKNDTTYSDIVIMPSSEFYGAGYQDIQTRVPSIKNATERLGWAPAVSLDEALKKTLDSFLEEIRTGNA
jgi:UDP-4-amino-4-deoxy-L-arabinose formyltransferase/UDP-glucuronic acid dehydrogenase (UDP-4-keto-hexauronic acid decarboxylating)